MSFYETYPSPAWLPYTICTPSIHTRGISRTNVTTPTQIWSANPSLSLYEVYPGPTWLPCTKCRPSIHTRDISRTNVTAICHIRNADLQDIHEIYPDTDVTAICHIRCANPSMSFYEVYPVQRDYANPSLSFYEVYPVQRDYANPSLSLYEVYPGPMWLGKPKYDLPTLHWVSTRWIQIPTSRMSLWRYANIQWDTPTFNDFYTRRTRRGIPKANVTAIHDTPTFNFMANVGVIYLTPTFNEL